MNANCDWAIADAPRAGMARPHGGNGRETLIFGTFFNLDAAAIALENLQSNPANAARACLLTDRKRHHQTPNFSTAPPSVVSFRGLARRLGIHAGPEDRPASVGSQRLLTHLDSILANGAAIVVARTTNAAQQLAVSRELLGAGCDLLLTHEIS